MDRLKSIWVHCDGSIYTKDLKEVKLQSGKIMKVPEAIAFNVGKQQAEYICRLHNSHLKSFNLMYQLHYIICNSGDGSNHLEWYEGSKFTLDELYKLEAYDPERYSSGDGIQIGTLNFENSGDYQRFIEMNPTLYLEEVGEELEGE